MNGTVTARYLYDGQLKPVAVVDGEGNVERRYLYALHANVPEAILEADGTTYRIIHDHLGGPRMVVNAATGDIVKEVAYDEFGNITAETGTYALPFGFAGGIRDTDTGLTKFGARWYDPEVGRWISKEPLGFAGSMNFYTYAGNDPVNYIDVNGLFSFLTPQQLDTAQYRDMKNEYLRFQAYILKNFSTRMNLNKGFRFDIYKKLFGVSRDKILEAITPGSGPLISMTERKDSRGTYLNEIIGINKGMLLSWDGKDDDIVVLLEHELAHYFDEKYNQAKCREEFSSKVRQYPEGCSLYDQYYQLFEAGAKYEIEVYGQWRPY